MKLRNLSTKLGVGAGVAALALLTVGGTAFASTSNPTETATISQGSLSVTPTGNGSVSVTLGQNVTANGTLPAATWDDATGTGEGWSGTVQTTPFVYTSTWTPYYPGGGLAAPETTALTTDTSAPFTDTVDGIIYKVTITGDGTFSYTSNDSSDPSGSGTFTAGTAAAVGKYGLTITIQSGIDSGEYELQCGTQNASAMTFANTGTTITPVSTSSTAPTVTNTGSTITPGDSAGDYGTAVQILSAAVDTGMGAYDVTPAITFTPDNNSWAKAYTANVLYSITSGPYATQVEFS
jgi:hypothetical protein